MLFDSINRVHLSRNCRMAWNRLRPFPHPSARVRRCPQCHGLIYEVRGLDFAATLALIRATEHREPTQLFLRPDGTVATSDRHCRPAVWRLWPAVRRLVCLVAG